MSYVVHQTRRSGGGGETIELRCSRLDRSFRFLFLFFLLVLLPSTPRKIAVGVSAASVGPAVLCVLWRSDGVGLAEGRK